MSKVHALRLAALSTVIAASTVASGALTTRAAGGASYGTAPAAACTGVPKVYIYTAKKSKLANYYPTSVQVKVSTTASLCITNATAATQTVTYQGSPLSTIASKKTGVILCNRPNTATFSLTSNTKAALHLTCIQ